MDAFAVINEVKAGRLRPVYLLYGKETFLRDRIFEAIRRQAVPAELEDLNVTVLDGTEGPVGRALDLARTTPFLAPYRVVAVRDWPPLLGTQAKGGAKGETEDGGADPAAPAGSGEETALLEYLTNPPPTTVLVLLAGEGVDRRRKLFRQLSTQHLAVECQVLKEQELVVWVRDRAEELGKRFELQAARELAQRLPPNLTLIDTELAKLVTYVGDAPAILRADVEAVVPGMPENNIFELLGCISRRERDRALGLLERMLRDGEPAPRLIFMIARELRLLLTVKVLSEQGQGPTSIEERLHLYPKVVRGLLDATRGFSRTDLVAALGRVLEADVAVKTSQMDPRLVLQLLLLDLSRKGDRR